MVQAMLMGFVGILPYIVAVFLLWMTYKFIHDRLTHYNDDDQIKANNEAAGLNRGGAYLGVGIAASGSLIGNDLNYLEGIMWFIVDGLAAIAVFTAASFAIDAVLLRRIRNATHIEAGNKAVATVEAAAMISLGVITCASFSGGGQEPLPGLGSAVLFSVLGVALLAGTYLLFGFLYNLRHKCDVEREIESGNTAMAKEVSGFLLAMSVTLWFSISGDFTGWINDIASFFIAAAASLTSVSLAWFLSGRLLSSTPSIIGGVHQRNDTAASLKLAAMVAFGLIAGLVTFS